MWGCFTVEGHRIWLGYSGFPAHWCPCFSAIDTREPISGLLLFVSPLQGAQTDAITSQILLMSSLLPFLLFPSFSSACCSCSYLFPLYPPLWLIKAHDRPCLGQFLHWKTANGNRDIWYSEHFLAWYVLRVCFCQHLWQGIAASNAFSTSRWREVPFQCDSIPTGMSNLARLLFGARLIANYLKNCSTKGSGANPFKPSNLSSGSTSWSVSPPFGAHLVAAHLITRLRNCPLHPALLRCWVWSGQQAHLPNATLPLSPRVEIRPGYTWGKE